MERTNTLPLRALAITLALASSALANVEVKQSGGTLKIKCDPAGGLLRVEGNGFPGELVVAPNTPTAKTFVGVRNVVVRGSEGDDAVQLSAFQIGGSLRVKLDAGDDAFAITTVGLGTTLPVVIGGNVDIRMGGQLVDFVGIFADPTFGVSVLGNLTIRGTNSISVAGTGGAPATEAADCVIGGNLRIERGPSKGGFNPTSSLGLVDVNVGGTTTIKLGAANDHVKIIRCAFAGPFAAKLGDGDDICDFFQQPSTFDAATQIDAGNGTDTIAAAFALTFAVEPTFAFDLKA